MSDVGSARRAKEELKAKISGEPWCVGVGVEREDGVGFIVRVTIRSGALDAARAAIPERLGDVRIKVIESDP
ncbi:hypothetical protein WMF31_18700 [Sorangium sp. So ce1036]|uniref:hypothetical protein n=1 Tax=Sorangium sp. So ce1036 TaxID=3133328 RepID=UPI003F10CFD0